MFSYEERTKAVNLIIQSDISYADVVHELDDPSKIELRKWYEEYQEYGDPHDKYNEKSK